VPGLPSVEAGESCNQSKAQVFIPTERDLLKVLDFLCSMDNAFKSVCVGGGILVLDKLHEAFSILARALCRICFFLLSQDM
jgi:hypothetical protein